MLARAITTQIEVPLRPSCLKWMDAIESKQQNMTCDGARSSAGNVSITARTAIFAARSAGKR